jgi:DNA-binding transcriptional MocR family regulator
LVGLERGLREVDEVEGEEGGGRGRGDGTRRVYKDPAPHRKLYRHVVYLVATSSNPSGKTLSLARREQLIRLARKYDALVISDDVYDFLQWPTSPSPSPSTPCPLPVSLPTLSLIDATLPYDHDPSPNNPSNKRLGNAISNASFSKLVGPGIRTGWIHGTPDFVYGFSQTGSNRSGGAASQFSAAVVHQVLVSGELDEWLEKVVRPGLRRRHAAVVKMVVSVLGPLGVWLSSAQEDDGRGVFGGYFIWLALPEGVDAEEVAARAKEEEELIVAPGRLFEVKGDEETARFPGNVRLCFSWEGEEDVVEGVTRLGRVLRRMLDGTGATTAKKGVGEAKNLEEELQMAC